MGDRGILHLHGCKTALWLGRRLSNASNPAFESPKTLFHPVLQKRFFSYSNYAKRREKMHAPARLVERQINKQKSLKPVKTATIPHHAYQLKIRRNGRQEISGPFAPLTNLPTWRDSISRVSRVFSWWIYYYGRKQDICSAPVMELMLNLTGLSANKFQLFYKSHSRFVSGTRSCFNLQGSLFCGIASWGVSAVSGAEDHELFLGCVHLFLGSDLREGHVLKMVKTRIKRILNGMQMWCKLITCN